MSTNPNPATFDELELTEPLLRGLAKAGFDTPTAVQQQVIPAAMQRLDLLVSAATGSGKTVAFLLPIMQHLLDQRPRRIEPREDSGCGVVQVDAAVLLAGARDPGDVAEIQSTRRDRRQGEIEGFRPHQRR